jgi:hypothetical protein
MKVNSISLSLALALALALGGATPQNGSAQTASETSKTGAERVPVVLELFTSEGCSSCPPADALLAKLAELQPVAGVDVIGLEEHVDYWDHQGWVDPFSSPQWTQRQQDYAARFTDHGVYTPELVVNGRSAFVGSRISETYRAIKDAVAQPQTVIRVSVLKSEKNNHERVKIEIGPLLGAQQDDTAEVWFAVAESGLHSAVSGGENAGQDLHHAPVVRWLHKAGNAAANATPSFSGESDVKVDSAWKRANLRIIAFVQEKRSRRILGAALTRLEP